MVSIYIFAIAAGWLGAHIVKYTIRRIAYGNSARVSQLFNSGGMPSAHVASCTSLGTVIALQDGIDSGLFGLMFLLTIIVFYDAINVRRSSGLQAEAIGGLIKQTGSKIEPPRVITGHTLSEALVGLFFGIVIGLMVFLLIN